MTASPTRRLVPAARRLTRLVARDRLPLALLGAAFVAAFLMYLPALHSGFFADDYVYLDSVRNLSFAHYLCVSLVPASENDRLMMARDFWRPLYFLSFEASVRLFGRHTEWYHLVNVAIHLANVALVCLVAVRLGASRLGAAFGAAVFAVHPAAIGAVAWISSVNSAGFTFALAAMLAFVAAVRASGRRAAGPHALCLGLFVTGLLFRETVVSILGLAAAWYVLVEARARLGRRQTWLQLAPLAATTLIYYLVRTKGMTAPLSNPYFGARYGSHVWSHGWWYIKLGALPHALLEAGWAVAVQRLAGVALLGVALLAAVFRRWLLMACFLGFLVSLAPIAAIQLTTDARYFYFPGALLGITTAALATEFGRIERLPAQARDGLLAVVTVGVLIVGAGYGATRVQQWVDDFPAVHQSWIDQLRAENPSIAPGATVYAGNTPGYLAIFGGVNLGPTVAEYYPGVRAVVLFDPADPKQKPQTKPGDVVFIYRGGR